MSPRKAAALRENDRSLREHLIETAAGLIAEQGMAGLTVRAIARRAGVADGVLYNHFTDKEELLANALLARIRTVESGLGDLPAAGVGSVRDNLTAHLNHGLALHKQILPAVAGLTGQPAVLAKFQEMDTGETWRDRLMDYLRAEQALGRLARDADLAVAAAMLVGICHDAVLAGLLAPGLSGPEPSAESVIATLLDGIDGDAR